MKNQYNTQIITKNILDNIPINLLLFLAKHKALGNFVYNKTNEIINRLEYNISYKNNIELYKIKDILSSFKFSNTKEGSDYWYKLNFEYKINNNNNHE